MLNIAVVTGASSGLGQEYVRQLARDEAELEEIWVGARRRERLDALREQVGGLRPQLQVRILALDLTREGDLDQLEAALKQQAPEIRVLINAAGFGKAGSYAEVGRRESAAMIDLNCRAAVEVTQICLPYLTKGGRILQICSTSAFQPFPYLNVYAASKAFLYRYSRGLRVELFPRKIRVTAVCPYWIRDTEFISIAQTTDRSKAIRHFPLSSTRHNVVRRSLLDSALGLPVSTPGPVCTLHRIVAKFIPSELMMGIWALLRRV